MVWLWSLVIDSVLLHGIQEKKEEKEVREDGKNEIIGLDKYFVIDDRRFSLGKCRIIQLQFRRQTRTDIPISPQDSLCISGTISSI
jgi:hypothetical protein